jgi:hypothetical protein
MKLALFTPLPPAHTEIGNVSARILSVLNGAFDLTVFTETLNFDPQLSASARIIPFTADTINWKDVHLAGLPLYQIGNNVHFHSEIIKVARKNPGIVVLHDLSIHQTVLNMSLLKGLGRWEYYAILEKYGGLESISLAKKVLEEEQPKMHELSTRYPLFQWVVENAIGVVTHNPANTDTIRSYYNGPVLYAPLPMLPASSLQLPIDRCRKNPPYQILIFGFLGSDNRRLIPFLNAFAGSPIKDQFRITIAGKYDKKFIRDHLREAGLKKYVQLKGFVTDEELDHLLKNSDLIPNLRWPSRGESSATQLRIWNFSLPSLVTRTAYYATLPNDAVSFVSPESEEEDIQKHLQSFAHDPESYFAQGVAGNKYLHALHSAESFVENLQSFIPHTNAFSGKLPFQLYGRSLAQTHLREYPDPLARSLLMQRCADEISDWMRDFD